MNSSYYILKDGTQVFSIEIRVFIEEYNKFVRSKKLNEIYLGFSHGTFTIRDCKTEEVFFVFSLLSDYNKFKKSLLGYEQ